MTSYSFRLTLNEPEVFAVRDALVRYADFCDLEKHSGRQAPADPRRLRGIVRRLFDQSSTFTIHELQVLIDSMRVSGDLSVAELAGMEKLLSVLGKIS